MKGITIFTVALIVLASLFFTGCINLGPKPTKDTLTFAEMKPFVPHPQGFQIQEGSPEEVDSSCGNVLFAGYDIAGHPNNRVVEFEITDSFGISGCSKSEYRYLKDCLASGECKIEKYMFKDGVRHSVYVSHRYGDGQYYVPITNRTFVTMTTYGLPNPDTVATVFFGDVDWTGLRNKALGKHEDE